LDAKKLAANDYCQSCHPDSFHQWQRSANRFSSFNNPFYRKSVELMADRVGRERTKWCSGCHDPVVLFTGQMGAATQAKFSYDSFEAQQGLTCMSCHSIAEVKDLRGNGSYVIEESKQYPFAFSKNRTLVAINRLLIRMEPSLHRKTFLKAFHRTPEFCSSCHKVALIPALNDYHWMRGQNHYDTWYDSGVSGRAVRSFYDPPQAKACRDCHLPALRSAEFANGTADSNETWVSLEGVGNGEKFFRSGVLDSAGRLDPAADRLWTYVVDHTGAHMDRRQPQDIHVNLYNNGIPPGAARVVHYRVRVPDDARGSVELAAGVHYRKFTRDYTSFSLGSASPSLPVTTLAEDRVRLPVRSMNRKSGIGNGESKAPERGNPDKPWLRWNDYGIGLFLQGDLKG